MEDAILQVSSPSRRGQIKIADGSSVSKYSATFETGDEKISKDFASVALSVAWILQMEAACKNGKLQKHMRDLNKKTYDGSAVPYLHNVTRVVLFFLVCIGLGTNLSYGMHSICPLELATGHSESNTCCPSLRTGTVHC